MGDDAAFVPPARFPPGSTFWRLKSDGRIVWVDGSGTARDAIGLVVPIGEILDAGERVMERDFRSALVHQDRSCPLRLPSGAFIGGRSLAQARYSLPPVISRGDPPWAQRSVRLFPVLDPVGAVVAELWFSWKEGAWHLGRSEFIAGFEQRLRSDDCGRLCLAAAERQWATLNAFHPLALPWYCAECRHNHPEESWRTGSSRDQDNSPSRLYGVMGFCPYGHERAIAH